MIVVVRPGMLRTPVSFMSTETVSLRLVFVDSGCLIGKQKATSCARKSRFRRGQDRGDDRHRDPPAIPRRPATPRREYKDFLRPEDFSCSKPEDVTAFLCNFLVERGVKPMKVLKTDGLPHATPDDWRDADAVQALYKAAEPFMPETVASDTDSAATDTSCDSQAPSASDDSS